MTFETALQNMRDSMRASRVVMVEPDQLSRLVALKICRCMNGEKLCSVLDENNTVDRVASFAKEAIVTYVSMQHDQLLKD